MRLIAEVIKAARKRKGLTQRELARLIGTGEMRVARWERGASAPSAKYVFRLADALGIDPRDLVADEAGGDRG
ncbi:helix-turn-helix domain-containing protein [Halostreptopolyspora alba]|uniref:XRE family transcriptional regulator n=1 Tax=Halostreptopolyspora alba TaxID=2487137 RepID=A0A3N0EAB0_9ACTN|nr:XRE family transcriptional regulator [Nocardiopsaceae bacterium YIM 96095]